MPEIGQIISHYINREELRDGGMHVVYSPEYSRLLQRPADICGPPIAEEELICIPERTR